MSALHRRSVLRRPTPSWRPDPWLAGAALLALIPIFTIVRPGLPNTADGQVHLLRALETSHLLRSGILYPRWAPDFYFGYGYPFFNFYAPGAHLLISLIAVTGLGVLRGMVAVQALALLLYPTGAYLAARALLTTRPSDHAQRGRAADAAAPAALLSAALYLYAPLRWRELFVEGNLSQLLALALLPWSAWLLAVTARRGSARWAVAAGTSLALLVYIHHPSALLAFPLLAVYALSIAIIAARALRSDRARRNIICVGLAFLFGVALSALFWLPSVVEQHDVNLTAIQGGMFNARLNVLSLVELLSPPVLLDDAALNPPMPNSLGTAQVLLALAGLIVAARWAAGGRQPRPEHAQESMASQPSEESDDGGGWSQRQAGTALLVIAGLLVLSLALVLPISVRLWEILPLARFVAFPWRMLGPALLWAALLGGTALFLVPLRLRAATLAALLVLVPLSIAPYLFPRPFGTAHEPTLADIARYELEGGARGTASANEYLPRWVEDPDPPPVMVQDYLAGRDPDRLDRASLPAGGDARQVLVAPLEDVYQLDLPETATVRIRRFYFPGWRAWLDGQPAPISPGKEYGLIEVTVPPGSHELRLRFASTPARAIAGILVLGALVLAVGTLWLGRKGGTFLRKTDATEKGQGPAASRSLLVATITILLLTGSLLVFVGPHTRWFRQRSTAEAPAAMQHPLHARFANGIELVGYDLRNPAPRQGENLEVRLYWRALQPQATNVHPFLHLDAMTGQVTWANQTKAHAGDKPSTVWPVGFYVVDDYRLAIPPDTPPVVAHLRAGLLDEHSDLVPLADGQELASLAPVRVRERYPLSAGSVPGREETYRLGPAVRLAGSSAVITGTPPVLNLDLYWQATAPVPMDYTVFIHVLDSKGKMLVQGDGPPVNGWYPSTAWEPGQVVADRRRVPLPTGVNPADVRIALGLYTPADGTRAPVFDMHGARQPEDQILLSAGP